MTIATARSFVFFAAAKRSGTRMHNKMAHAVLHAPLAFYHTNSSGRVLNRFSKVSNSPFPFCRTNFIKSLDGNNALAEWKYKST